MKPGMIQPPLRSIASPAAASSGRMLAIRSPVTTISAPPQTWSATTT